MVLWMFLITVSALADEAVSPANDVPEDNLTAEEARQAAALMRVNHCGEVCAQALYQGQGLNARSPVVRATLQQSAKEEQAHLQWCQQRINELGAHTSYLAPFWYGASFTLGYVVALAGDSISLGFVAATEELVCEHLRDHMRRLPLNDEKSYKILFRMLEDEDDHGTRAMSAGGETLPWVVRKMMASGAKLMTYSTYYI